MGYEDNVPLVAMDQGSGVCRRLSDALGGCSPAFQSGKADCLNSGDAPELSPGASAVERG
jgi:hypothetical protein